MATKFSGGCLCGAVRYECDADPLFTGNCHCRDCQKASGGPYDPAIALPAAAIKVTGSVKYFDSKADNGNTVSRGFCTNCGSRVTAKSSGMPDMLIVTAGTLDDPRLFKPQMDIYTASAQPWDHMDPALPKFDKMPL
jgi:hypothetical protein